MLKFSLLLIGLSVLGSIVSAEDNIVDNDKSEYTILTPSQPDKVEQFAAEELQKYFKQITGLQLQIVASDFTYPDRSVGISDESSRAKQNTTKPIKIGNRCLSVGYTKLVQEKQINVPSRYFDDDGFIIKTVGKDVVLLGANSRGTLYAVYEYLEQIGCRWYAPQFDYYQGKAEYVPSKKNVELQKFDILDQPDWKYRKIDGDQMVSHTAESWIQIFDWCAKNRVNSIPYAIEGFHKPEKTWFNWKEKLLPELEKRGIIIELGKHGIYDMALPVEKYFDAHPEWFCFKNGERQRKNNLVFSTANSTAVAEFTKNMVELIRNYPEMKVLQLWPPDNRNAWSEEPEDLALGSVTDRHAKLVKAVADVVKKEYPNLKVEFLAYQLYTEPPTVVEFPENTIIDFCPINRSFQYRANDYTNTTNAEYDKKLLGWLKSGYKGDISLYSYYAKYAWNSLPVIIPKMIAEEVKYYKSIGVKGMSIYSEPDNWFNFELNHLAVAQCSWDNELDFEKYLDQYCEVRYGPAKELMLKFINIMENTVPQYCTLPGTEVKSVDDLKIAKTKFEEAKKLLDEAYKLAKDNKQVEFFLDKISGMLEHAKMDIELREAAMNKDKEKVKGLYSKITELFNKYEGQGIALKKAAETEHKKYKKFLEE